MTPQEYIRILTTSAKLKTTMRHCFTEGNRQESVAEHSWRLALMAMLLSGEDEYAEYDLGKVIRMCLIHDLGEAFTGDIPAFQKTESDTHAEDDLFIQWVASFPESQHSDWTDLLNEMNALETKEAQLYKALDKLEALISHNESDIETWLPLEYDLQLSYGQENMRFLPFLKAVRKEVDSWTLEKIAEKLPK